MKLSVATNFEPELVEELRPFPVTELYGKLRQDVAGGGRASYQLAGLSRTRFAEHVRHARSVGFGFNYLLNAACLGNRDITRKGQRELERLLDWVSEVGATTVTVAAPNLLRLVKTRFPHLRVRISVFAGVDRVRKAQMWEELGADCIVLDSLLVNRELESLRQIRKHISCDLELLANNSCLQGCALSPTHMNALAHASKSWDANKGFFIDWCFLKCTEMKLRDPVNYIRSEWIRPEDLHIYEELGFDRFKLVERDIPTAIMVKRVKAYAERRYDGNLLDLVQPYAFSGVDDKRYYRRGLARLGWILRHAIRPGLVNPARMMHVKRLAEIRGMTCPVEGEPPVYVDNRALDGFMNRFLKTGCRDQLCEDCRWCHRHADQAVRIDPALSKKALGTYDRIFEALDGGSMWRYGSADATTATRSDGCNGCSSLNGLNGCNGRNGSSGGHRS